MLEPINLNLFTIAVILVGILTIIAVVIDEVNAETREDIEAMKDSQDDLRERDIELDELLVENKEDVNILEEILEVLKDEFKQLKRDASSSWEAVKGIDDKEYEIIQAKIDIKTNQDERNDLLDEKSDIILNLRELVTDILRADTKLKSTNFNVTDISKAIGVKLSNSCITAITHNITTSCPTYEDLLQLDSSEQRISGEFINDDGFFHRDASPMINSWRWYDLDDRPRIFIDPPHGMVERIQMITLENNFGVYLTIDDRILENGTRSYHEGRYVEKCRDAVLDTNNWLKTLPITIYTMRIGCPDLNENDRKYIFRNATEINVATSPNWQHKVWVDESKISCKTLCTEY